MPVIVQDAPAWTGVPLPVDLLVSLAAEAPNAAYAKVEAPPAGAKIRALRQQGVHVIDGYGALHVVEDLAAGIEAVMPGCALPGLYLRLWRAHTAGDAVLLWDEFARALPLLSFQMSRLDTFVAVQKTLMQQAGVLASSRLRRPGRQLTDHQSSWLGELMTRAEARRYLGAPNVAAQAT